MAERLRSKAGKAFCMIIRNLTFEHHKPTTKTNKLRKRVSLLVSPTHWVKKAKSEHTKREPAGLQ